MMAGSQNFIKDYRGFLLVARYTGRNWCGYIGRLDGVSISIDEENRYGLDITGEMSVRDILLLRPGLNPDLILPGFDCAHYGDINISPQDESVKDEIHGEEGCYSTIWTKAKVFKRLEKAADRALDEDEVDPRDPDEIDRNYIAEWLLSKNLDI